MATGMIRCDNPGCKGGENKTPKVVAPRDAHGWFEIKTYVTKPTREQVESIPDQQRQMAEMQGYKMPTLAEAAEPPQLVGGDFCTIDCMLQYIQDNKTVIDQLRPETAEDFAQRVKEHMKEEDMLSSEIVFEPDPRTSEDYPDPTGPMDKEMRPEPVEFPPESDPPDDRPDLWDPWQ